jgi:uncharacterized protein GlcG (DUF336 family)
MGKALGITLEQARRTAGGIPIKRGGEVGGAIGVSGGSGTEDQSVAEAGAAAATA